MKAAVVIPVFNEAERVLPVVEAAKRSPYIYEIVVVNDGSTDNTGQILETIENISVFTHSENKGKGEALDTGMNHVRSAGFGKAVFLDGDLRGLRPDHIDKLLLPLQKDKALMAIGYLGLRKMVVQKALLNKWGALSGQRALDTNVWDLLSLKDKHGFNVEAALNARLRKNNVHHDIARVALDGVGHVGKRQKEGTWPRAIWAYSKTYSAAMVTYGRIEAESVMNAYSKSF